MTYDICDDKIKCKCDVDNVLYIGELKDHRNSSYLKCFCKFNFEQGYCGRKNRIGV